MDKSLNMIDKKAVEFTYIELPLWHARPGISHTLYDHRFVASLILLDELIYCDIIDMNSLDCVYERIVFDF